jgi:hypothetical protein
MPRATRTTEENATPTNGVGVPARGDGVVGMPRRNAGRKRSDYSAWEPEVQNARDNLGLAFPYYNCSKAASVAQGLKREFGVDARTQDIDKETGVGTLWLAYPAVAHDDDTYTEDTERVEAIKAKFAK